MAEDSPAGLVRGHPFYQLGGSFPKASDGSDFRKSPHSKERRSSPETLGKIFFLKKASKFWMLGCFQGAERDEFKDEEGFTMEEKSIYTDCELRYIRNAGLDPKQAAEVCAQAEGRASDEDRRKSSEEEIWDE